MRNLDDIAEITINEDRFSVTDDIKIMRNRDGDVLYIDNVVYEHCDKISGKILTDEEILHLTDYEQLFRNLILGTSNHDVIRTKLSFFKNKIRSVIYNWGDSIVKIIDNNTSDINILRPHYSVSFFNKYLSSFFKSLILVDKTSNIMGKVDGQIIRKRGCGAEIIIPKHNYMIELIEMTNNITFQIPEQIQIIRCQTNHWVVKNSMLDQYLKDISENTFDNEFVFKDFELNTVKIRCPTLEFINKVLINLRHFYSFNQHIAMMEFVKVCSIIKAKIKSHQFIIENLPEFSYPYHHYRTLMYDAFGKHGRHFMYVTDYNDQYYEFNTMMDFIKATNTFDCEINETIYHEFIKEINHIDLIDSLAYLLQNPEESLEKIYVVNDNLKILIDKIIGPHRLQMIKLNDIKNHIDKSYNLVFVEECNTKIKDLASIRYGLQNRIISYDFSKKYYSDNRIETPSYTILGNYKQYKYKAHYCYLVWCLSEHTRGIPIYKIGKTTNLYKRLSDYRNAKIFSVNRVNDSDKCEEDIIKQFRTTFKLISKSSNTNCGNEYFEGDINEMIKLFNKICNNYKPLALIDVNV